MKSAMLPSPPISSESRECFGGVSGSNAVKGAVAKGQLVCLIQVSGMVIGYSMMATVIPASP